MKNAQVVDIPGMDPATALAFQLAQTARDMAALYDAGAARRG